MSDALCARLQVVVNQIADGNAAEFAHRAEIPYRSMQNYLRGDRRPDVDALNKIAHLGVNVHWLLTGESEQRLSPGSRVERRNEEQRDLAKAAERRRAKAREALAAAFSKFEEHELDMRDQAGQPDYVLDANTPNRLALLDQFCTLYARNGPKSLGLAEWMMSVYPQLTPEDVVDAMQPEGGDDRPTWVQPAKTDWGMWLNAIAELSANGVTPQEVLAKFRPEGFVAQGESVRIKIGGTNSGPSPNPDITNLIF